MVTEKIKIKSKEINKNMPWSQYMRLLRSICGVLWRETHTWMGMYGASSPKPTILMSSSAWVFELWRKLDTSIQFDNEDVTYKTEDSNGKVRVTGGPGLKATQAYTEQYGRTVCAEWEHGVVDDIFHDVIADPDDKVPWHEWKPNCQWCDDAKLSDVAEFLNIPSDRPL